MENDNKVKKEMEEKNNKLEKKIKLLKSKLKLLNMNLKKEEEMNLQQANEIPLLNSKEEKEKKIGGSCPSLLFE